MRQSRTQSSHNEQLGMYHATHLASSVPQAASTATMQQPPSVPVPAQARCLPTCNMRGEWKAARPLTGAAAPVRSKVRSVVKLLSAASSRFPPSAPSALAVHVATRCTPCVSQNHAAHIRVTLRASPPKCRDRSCVRPRKLSASAPPASSCSPRQFAAHKAATVGM